MSDEKDFKDFKSFKEIKRLYWNEKAKRKQVSVDYVPGFNAVRIRVDGNYIDIMHYVRSVKDE